MTVTERLDRIGQAMRERGWDLIVCALPANVLALSGYWPIIGTGLASIDCEGQVRLLVPEDEKQLAGNGWVKDISTFQCGSLETLAAPSHTIEEPLRQSLGSRYSHIGYEAGEVSEPASYVAMNLYGEAMPELLTRVFPQARLASASELLAEVRALKTGDEIARIRAACGSAGRAYAFGSSQICTGMEEIAAAGQFRGRLELSAAERPGGWVSCMSGVNSGHAYGAFARSTHKQIAPGELVLTHCNSYEDGYWTDITRTYVMGEPSDRQRAMFAAIYAARTAALDIIRPGIAASEVDRRVREVLGERGFGREFKHSTGHGVGFGAIEALAAPRLHPASTDRLQAGMVFNVEPGIYFPGYGGMRHCDVLALTDEGTELLTPFQCTGEELIL